MFFTAAGTDRSTKAPPMRTMGSAMFLNHTGNLRFVAVGRAVLGANAWGAAAIGALAIGALAIGRLAVGRLAVGKAALKSVSIDDLKVGDLTVMGSLRAPALQAK